MIVLMNKAIQFVCIFFVIQTLIFEYLFFKGHYCDAGKSDSIACVTHIEPHPIYECLSPNEICNGINDCINNQDEHLCS